MLKNLFNLIKRNNDVKVNTEETNEEIVQLNNKVEDVKQDITFIKNEDIEQNEVKENVKTSKDIDILDKEAIKVKTEENQITEADEIIIKRIKIEREKSIKAINIYTKEEIIFDTYRECSKKLKIPMGYIKENLIYGYTTYYGEGIIYLYKELLNQNIKEEYLYSNKSPAEIYKTLNDKIFTAKISEDKRNTILSNEKIENKHMNYIFECIDKEYDDYFKKYKSIIQRGGSKKIELINTKGEIIEVFRSSEDCAKYINKEKNEVIEMLKSGQTKVGRYHIRYSLRKLNS